MALSSENFNLAEMGLHACTTSRINFSATPFDDRRYCSAKCWYSVPPQWDVTLARQRAEKLCLIRAFSCFPKLENTTEVNGAPVRQSRFPKSIITRRIQAFRPSPEYHSLVLYSSHMCKIFTRITLSDFCLHRRMLSGLKTLSTEMMRCSG